MKKFLIIILLLVIIGAAGIIGYRLLDDKIPVSGKTLTSDDNKYSMEVPSSWNTADRPSSICVLAAENRNSSMYAALSINSYVTDGVTIDDYISAYISDIASNSDDPQQQKITSAPQQATFGDNTGYYFELLTEAGGIAVCTRNFVFATADGYLHIDVVLPENADADAQKTAENIIASVKYSSDGNVSS